jgi:hypothetical protein
MISHASWALQVKVFRFSSIRLDIAWSFWREDLGFISIDHIRLLSVALAEPYRKGYGFSVRF